MSGPRQALNSRLDWTGNWLVRQVGEREIVMLTFLLLTALVVLSVGMLPYLVYRETEVDLPPRHCIYHRQVTRHG